MKKLLLASLLTTVGLYASESTAISDQTYINDVMNSSNKLNFINGKNDNQVGGQFVIGEDLMIVNVPISFKLTDALSADVNIPIINIKNVLPTLVDYTDIGDVSVGLNYKYGDFTADNGLHVASIRYKSTTGDASRGLGVGKPAYTLAYNFAKDISASRLNAYASYTINDPLALGDALSLMAGGSHELQPSGKLDVHMKISYLDIAQEGFISGNTQTNLWIEASSKTLVEGMYLGAGIKFPIIDDVNFPGGVTVDGTNGILFYISTANLFSQTE